MSDGLTTKGCTQKSWTVVGVVGHYDTSVNVDFHEECEQIHFEITELQRAVTAIE